MYVADLSPYAANYTNEKHAEVKDGDDDELRCKTTLKHVSEEQGDQLAAIHTDLGQRTRQCPSLLTFQ